MQCKTREWAAEVPPLCGRDGYPARVAHHVRLWVGVLLAAGALSDRIRRDERGQSAVEVIGILALVALLVLSLTQSEVLSGVRRAVTDAVADLFDPAS